MTDFFIIMALMCLTTFMAFIAGFAFCQWGHMEKAKQERENLMWESIEWD